MIPTLRRSSPEESAATGLAWAVYPADLLTPVAAFDALREGSAGAALLESVDGPRELGRYSFLCLEPDGALRVRGDQGTLEFAGAVETLTGDLSGPSALREAHRRAPRAQGGGARHPDLPPFTGGWIGFASYELSHGLESTVAPDRDASAREFADLHFDHFNVVVSFDHRARTVTVVVPDEGSSGTPDARLDRIADRAFSGERSSPGFRVSGTEPTPRMDRGAFEDGVRRIKDAIRRGEVFQCVLSQAFDQRFEGDPFVLYRALRMVNPAPHMFFFDSEGVQLVGSSPERLVAARDGRIELVPIAGTRRRGDDDSGDAALAAELRSDPKERAEHDMLVDLARNDAGRVARTGTVVLDEYQALLRLPRVQHLVSRVSAELAAGRDAIDALAASFPAGTVSGAPKVRAMQLIDELEGAPRGPYGGAFGYLDAAGNLDMALAIRTVVCRAGSLAIQAGAGVVHDSDPAAEYEETLHKARALFEAVQLAATEPFQPAPALTGGAR